MTATSGQRPAASIISRSRRPARPPGPLAALRIRRPGSPRQAAAAAMRLIAIAGLVIDAYVHLDLASTYSEAQATINEGVLFRAEAALALITVIALTISRRRLPFVLSLAVSASALALILVSRYVNIGPFGPFPDLYDPVWYPEKLWAAGGEAGAAVASAAAILLLGIRSRIGASSGAGTAASSAPPDERGPHSPRINHRQ
jgi:hypothetical protein